MVIGGVVGATANGRAAIAIAVSATVREALTAGVDRATAPGLVVDVVETTTVAEAEIVIAAVIEEVTAAPVAAEEAGAEIAEAVVDAAVVADARAPVAGVPKVCAAAVTPVAGCPESSHVGGLDPGSVDPLVAVVTPGPVAGRPDIAVTGADGLGVDRDDRRCDPDRQEDPRMSGGRDRKQSSGESGCAHQFTKMPKNRHCRFLSSCPARLVK